MKTSSVNFQPLHELRRRARRALTNVRPSIERVSTVIQLREEPAFEHWTSWTVFHGRGDSIRSIDMNREYLVVKQVSWNETDDWKKVEGLAEIPQSFELSLTTTQAQLDFDAFILLMRKGSEISVPLIDVEYYGGLDGVTYNLSIPRSYGFSLEWWTQGPDSWREMTTWAMELRSFFKESIANADLPPKLD